MTMERVLYWIDLGTSFLGGIVLLLVIAGVIAVAVMYVVDVNQATHAVRRTFPVIGRFRYLFERLGEYFRQYFFAMDREEMPFNRVQRSWAYRAAKNVDNTGAFGSTRDANAPGSYIFVNAAYPTLSEDSVPPAPMLIGPFARKPYLARSFFNISGMSYGALSKPAVQALSHGAEKAGIWLNTGEGGLAPWHLEGGADIVFQIGTAKYGVRNPDGSLSEERLREIASHPQVKMIEIKLSQGAKPGKGGLLPGEKVTEEIARIRHIPVGLDSVSPNRFPEITSVDDLLNFINHVRDVSGLPVGFKTVIGDPAWLDELVEAILRRDIHEAPDFITVDSADGGTGAAPMPLMDFVGLTIRESLPIVVDKLMAAGLKERIRVIASGKFITPPAVAWGLCVGADFINCARGFMFALGCIQAMQCNRNTCPTGVTTHDPWLQRGLVVSDKSERVANYARNMVQEVGTIAHSCGVREPRELRREHCRVVQPDGRSLSLASLHPYPVPPAKPQTCDQAAAP